jgi:hypothetical protein
MTEHLANAEGSHPETGALSDYVRSALAEPELAEIEAHLDVCLACRVWAARLEHAQPTEPTDELISGLVAASPDVPEGLLSAIKSEHVDQTPQAGDLWRCGRGDALLVWLRNVFDDGLVAVVPVVFDIELADELTLIKPAESNPLGLDLGFMVSVESHIDLRSLIGKVGTIDVADDIEALRQVRRGGPRNLDILVGTPIEMADDQRIEYQQLVSDLLGDCAPEAFDDDTEDDGTDGEVDLGAIRGELDELTWSVPDIKIVEFDVVHTAIDDSHHLLRVATVQRLNVVVVVVAVVGPAPENVLVSDVGTRVVNSELLAERADAVAAVIDTVTLEAVVVSPWDATDAIDVPTGDPAPPTIPDPLPLRDAVRKYLDARVNNWDAPRVSFDRGSIDVLMIAARASGRAVVDVVAEGQRAKTPEKKDRYVSVNGKESAATSVLIREMLAGSDAREAVTEFKRRVTT